MASPILRGQSNDRRVRRGASVQTDTRTTNLQLDKLKEGAGRYVIPPPPPTIQDVIQGNTFGYVMSGNFPTVSALAETKQKFSLVSETPAVPSPGDLIIRSEPPTVQKGVRYHKGHTSGTAGFQSGGSNSGQREEILKFPFANEADITESNQLGVAVKEHYAMSAVIPGYGYALGGETGVPPATDPSNPLGSLANQKFSFVSGGAAAIIGDGYSRPGIEPGPSNRLKNGIGHSSATDGYHVGGSTFYTVNRTGVFPFSSDVDATLHGSLNNVFSFTSGAESTEHGYMSEATKTPTANVNTQGPFTYVTSMARYPFANGTTSVTIGDATNLGTYWATGVSGETKGYSCGGYDALPSFSFTDNIMSHEYASSTNGTDVASLLGDTAAAGSTQS